MAPKTLLRRWWAGVSEATSRPTVLVTLSVIGCFMLWLASKQVKSTLRVFAGFHPLSQSQAKLPDKQRYFVFAVLTLTFVWLDLILLRWLFEWLRRMLAWCACRFGSGDNKTKLLERQKTMLPLRKNPMRSCKSFTRNYASMTKRAD